MQNIGNEASHLQKDGLRLAIFPPKVAGLSPFFV